MARYSPSFYAKQRPKPKSLWRQMLKFLCLKLPAFLVLIWLIGFGFFYTQLPSTKQPFDHQAAAAVVLTGGLGRIEAGFALLETGKIKRLLISGVNPLVAAPDLYSRSERAQALLECCVDLGREAADTIGNAEETARWVKSHHFSDLIFITSDYHIPRAQKLLAEALPDYPLIAYGVQSDAGLLLYLLEYNKYLVTLLRQSAPKPSSLAAPTARPSHP